MMHKYDGAAPDAPQAAVRPPPLEELLGELQEAQTFHHEACSAHEVAIKRRQETLKSLDQAQMRFEEGVKRLHSQAPADSVWAAGRTEPRG